MSFTRKITLFIAGLFLFAACTQPDAGSEADSVQEPQMVSSANTLTDAEVADGWKLLFDGKTTAGWRGYNSDSFPDKVWMIEDGVLIVSKTGTEEAGFGGDIVTTEAFGDFELSMDFAIADTSNSGIFYFIKEAEGESIWHNAPEYQILDDPVYISRDGLDATLKHMSGENYDMESSEVNPPVPVGEWNTAGIIVNYPKVEHWLNGVQTASYEIDSPEWTEQYEASKFSEYPDYARTYPAPIGLQDHGHEVRFRNIKIRTIE